MKARLGLMLVLAGMLGGCASSKQAIQLPAEADPAALKAIMTKVADWQLANPSKHHAADWTHGALYAGMTAWAQMADSDTYFDALAATGTKLDWQPHRRVYHADDHCVGQMYIEMYRTFKDPKMIQGLQERFDFILANRSTGTLETGKQQGKDRWWWCDALFMAPPALAKLSAVTGDTRYLDFMNEEWWATTEYLYDTDEHLYYRDDRYFTQREANGEKIFWSRGNGWVFAGLARVLEELPAGYPDRPRYEKLFRDMAAKLIAIQPDDGMWHASLLDPASYPVGEASGTGFFCYGLAWGINQGYLDEQTYLPAVLKAWKGLVGCVHPDGKLGFVQPIGADPRQVNSDQTEVYGVGAFLLAGSEVYQIAVRSGMPAQKITVVNPTQSFRNDETVSLRWKDIQKAVPGLTRDNAAIFAFKSKRLRVIQMVEDGDTAELLFQTDLAPGDQTCFWVMKQPVALAKPRSEITTYCRFAPDRKDDFLWENDKAAYRMYGPALEYETITSGIDAWGKSVPYPVVDKFLEAYNKRKVPYHDDHGEGGDFYKVGPTLGCGGLAPFVDGKVVLPRNFVEWKVLANGPIRSTFELTYKPWQAGAFTISETKRISLDLGSSLSRIECRYASSDTRTLPLAAGIVLRDTSDKTWSAGQAIAYWQPTDPDPKVGWMGCGVVFGPDFTTDVAKADGHVLLTLNQAVGKPIVYYAGSCWDKNEEFNSFDKWTAYLDAFAQGLKNPVKVTFN